MSPTEIPALALLERCGVGPAASLCHLCPPPAQRGRAAAAEREKDVQNGMLGEPRAYLQGPSSPQQGEKQAVSKYYFLPLNLEENAREL